VRTTSREEKWWSRGHATLVEGPAGDWWMVYHGYENGYWTLGRQCLLASVEWTNDGWFRAGGGDLSRPIPMPRGGQAGPHGMALSDAFAGPNLGLQWSFADPGPDESARVKVGGGLALAARGTAPKDSPPLTFIAPDQAYELEAEIECPADGRAGLLLFYDKQLYCGLSFDGRAFVTHQYGMERGRPANPHGRRLFMRLRNDRHIVTFWTSGDGKSWVKFDRQMEVSGYHHNVRGGFMALRPGLFAAGRGEARFRNLAYRALP
jgi:beta-xylosidase